MPDNNDAGLRVDRWLWFTRFYKTRTIASAAVQAGHVRVNGERARPGKRVVPGDVVDLVKNQLLYRMNVLCLPQHRLSAVMARACYEEDSATREGREHMMLQLREDRQRMPQTRGKPDKRTRRLLRQRGRGQTGGAG